MYYGMVFLGLDGHVIKAGYMHCDNNLGMQDFSIKDVKNIID